MNIKLRIDIIIRIGKKMNIPADPDQLEQHLEGLIELPNEIENFRRERRLIIKIFSIVTWLQICCILFTISMMWNLQIVKIFGFGLTGLLKLLIGVQIVKLINEKEENLTEEDKEANAILRFIFFLLSFSMVMCIMNETTGEYHYVLCGPNLFIIGSTLILTVFKYRTFRFFIRNLFILCSIFWIFYYFLNVTWGQNVHWGLNIYFGLCGLICFPMVAYLIYETGYSYKSMGVLYYYSIILYFIVLSIILTWVHNPPFIQLTFAIHICYLLFCGACYKKILNFRIHSFFSSHDVFELTAQSNNVLKRKQENQLNISEVLPSGDALKHECRVCLTQSSVYALECDGFYHFCLCSSCLPDWMTQFKGKCLICNNIRNQLLKIKQQNNSLLAVGIFYLGH